MMYILLFFIILSPVRNLFISIINNTTINMEEGQEQKIGAQIIQIEPILSCDESDQRLLHEIQFVHNDPSAKEIEATGKDLTPTTFHQIKVRRWKAQEEWTIHRKYEDFQWLFKSQSLKKRCPGAILPFFPSESINLLIQKIINEQELKINKQMIALRLQQLQKFFKKICLNKKLCKTQQLKAFLLSGQQFPKRKAELQKAEVLKVSNSSFSVHSFFFRGLSRLANLKDKKQEISNNLLRIKFHLNNYTSQLKLLLKKCLDFIDLKRTELEWECPQTQIDNMEILKAKIITCRPFNHKIVQQIQGRIVLPLIEQLKKAVQIEQQINERVQISKLIQYLQSGNESKEDIIKLSEHTQLFDKTLLDEWVSFQRQWKQLVTQMDCKMREIWKEYSSKMSKIWK